MIRQNGAWLSTVWSRVIARVREAGAGWRASSEYEPLDWAEDRAIVPATAFGHGLPRGHWYAREPGRAAASEPTPAESQIPRSNHMYDQVDVSEGEAIAAEPALEQTFRIDADHRGEKILSLVDDSLGNQMWSADGSNPVSAVLGELLGTSVGSDVGSGANFSESPLVGFVTEAPVTSVPSGGSGEADGSMMSLNRPIEQSVGPAADLRWQSEAEVSTASFPISGWALTSLVATHYLTGRGALDPDEGVQQGLVSGRLPLTTCFQPEDGLRGQVGSGENMAIRAHEIPAGVSRLAGI